MTDIVYLVVTSSGVQRMTKKTVPNVHRGEHILKLEVEVKPEAFRDPLVTQHVTVEDWREGIDIADVEFKNGFITKEEATNIREQRLQNTIELLKTQGYSIEKRQEN